MQKIIFAGLDSVGKTSFLNALEEKYSTLVKMKPTLGPDRREFKLFGFTLSNWDLGGQESYRSMYFQEKERYFSQVNTLFFIFDVQDKARDDQAFKYLSGIIDVFKEFNEKPSLVICWHKFDKDIEQDEAMSSRVDALEARLGTALDGTFKMKTFKTTIFDKWSLLRAFSQGVVASSPKTTLIDSQLKDFARQTFSSAVMLLDANHLKIGAHASSPELLDVCEAIVPHAAFAVEKLGKYDIVADNLLLSLKPGKYYKDIIQGKEMLVLFIPVQAGEFTFSLLSLSKNSKTLKLMLKHGEPLARTLSNLMASFYL